jgi:cob(I)alamin adenosyltransferase
MKIYTRRGDTGETALLGGVRVWKNSPRLDAIGGIDELNAAIGLVRAENLPEDVDRMLKRLQNDLFNVVAELAAPTPAESPCPTIAESHVREIETYIDQCQDKLQPLTVFILPGGARSAALFHLARTICRRAERQLVALVQIDKQAVSPPMLAYINRLSDLCFVLARLENARSGVADAPWGNV